MAVLTTEAGEQLNDQTGRYDLVTETHPRGGSFERFGGDDWPLVIAFAESGFEDY